MKSYLTKKNIIASGVAAVLIIASILSAINLVPTLVGNGNNVTITKDEILGGTFRDVSITGNGTSLDPLIVEGNGVTVRCAKLFGNYIVLQNIIVEQCPSHSIFNKGANNTIQNNIVRHSVTENGINGVCGTMGGGGWGSGIKNENGSHNSLIRNNEVYENCGEGIGNTMSFDNIISGNIVHDNYSVNIYVDNSYRVMVRDNYVYCTGIYLRGGKRAGGIVNAEEHYPSWGWGFERRDNSVINNDVRNCNTGVTSRPSEAIGGVERRLLIEGNRLFGSIGRSIELSTDNDGVIVQNNLLDKPVYVLRPLGVTLFNNVVTSIVPTLQFPLPTISTVTQASTLTPTVTLAPTTTGTGTLPPISTFTPSLVPPSLTPTPSLTPLPTVCVPLYQICIGSMP